MAFCFTLQKKEEEKKCVWGRGGVSTCGTEGDGVMADDVMNNDVRNTENYRAGRK